MEKPTAHQSLYQKIHELLLDSKQNIVRSVNSTMVYTYYEIGRMIVEDEQQGKHRAEYGKQVLEFLSQQLSQSFGRGFSVVNLRQMRAFYQTYSIQQTVSAELKEKRFTLSWSHYLMLMRIENPDERSFYEIESETNRWSLRELQRQFDSALYERLVLSRDKDAVQQLSKQGQHIEKPTDILKDPYILEFLDL
ncbi:MAG: hypothetical protein JNJ85_13805, partial [Candidatus Kapabacteria bacterium]|nr:hypothetical protein [Candidatus Kapabacteria bacterium]